MDLRAATTEMAQLLESDFDHMVKPLLRSGAQVRDLPSIQLSAREGLSKLLPLRAHEAAFIEALWDRGEILPDLLISDPGVQASVSAMPLLQWKAQHVRRHHGLNP